MFSSPRIIANRPLLTALCVLLAALASHAQVSVRGIKVLGSKDTVEIEVESSDRVVPQTQVLTGPDRLVIDFPNTVPGPQMRNQSVERGEVKDVRFGRFQGKPPVTRIVVDLKTAQSYQVFPYGRTTIIKVVGAAPDGTAIGDSGAAPNTRPGLVSANFVPGTAQVQPAPLPQPEPLIVTFHKGLLAIKSDKATLSEVLLAIQQKTGAEVSVAAGAEQEKVVVDIGPAPAPEVLAQLLHGSKFNFLILSAANDSNRLDRVILTPRSEGGSMPLAQMPNNPAEPEDEVAANPQPPPPQPTIQNNRPPNDTNGPQDDPPDQ